ncbi:MAG: TolC family protein, partial [Bacteroidales bacterium]|nr:TolC family protein [Bacteroidales bacterium]
MKTKIRLIAILLFISQLVIAQESLNQYLETAANNNTALKSVFNEYMAALEKVAQVGVLQNPQLVFGYFILPVETKNGPQQAKISASQLFPWIGTLKSKEDIFTHSAKAKYSAFEEAKSKLFFDVKSSYFNLFYIQKSIDIALENIRILKSIKNIALIKISAGKASAADEIKTEIELANLENSIALLKDNFSVKSISFNNLLNIDKNSTILIPDSLWINNLSLSKQAILDSMQLNNYQLQSFDHNLEKFLSQEKFSKKEG